MVLLAFVVPVVLKKRTIRRLAALSAALVIAFELTVNYWFYPYVTWFEPFVFVALLLATNEKRRLIGRAINDQPPAISKKAISEKPVEALREALRIILSVGINPP